MGPSDNGVWLPISLYQAMAVCYYGDGPRHDEDLNESVEAISTAPTAPTPDDDEDFETVPAPRFTRGGILSNGGDA